MSNLFSRYLREKSKSPNERFTSSSSILLDFPETDSKTFPTLKCSVAMPSSSRLYKKILLWVNFWSRRLNRNPTSKLIGLRFSRDTKSSLASILLLLSTSVSSIRTKLYSINVYALDIFTSSGNEPIPLLIYNLEVSTSFLPPPR